MALAVGCLLEVKRQLDRRNRRIRRERHRPPSSSSHTVGPPIRGIAGAEPQCRIRDSVAVDEPGDDETVGKLLPAGHDEPDGRLYTHERSTVVDRIGSDGEPLLVTGTSCVHKTQGSGVGDHVLPGISIDVPAVCLRRQIGLRLLIGAHTDASAELSQPDTARGLALPGIVSSMQPMGA